MEAMHENKYPLVNDIRDPRFNSLRVLQHHQQRIRSGLYIIEGIRHLARAIENCAPIQSIFLEPSTLSNPLGRKLAEQLRRRGMPGIRLSGQLYRHLTQAAEPQGIGAVLRQQFTELSTVTVTKRSFFLAIESIESPGNLGTILRTAEAAGVEAVFVLNGSSDPFDPATVRASMGSLFSQRLIACSVHGFSAWARRNQVAVVGSSPKGLLDYHRTHYRWPTVLILGSEKRGLSDQVDEIADYMVRIPMQGRCDSINVSVAAGIMLFEMSNQRSDT